MNKKIMQLGWAIALTLSTQAQAGILDEVNNAADMAKLKAACTSSPWDSCQVVREVTRTTRAPQETEPAIWKEISTYQLIRSTPTKVAAAFADYSRYNTMFSGANLVSANLTEDRFPLMFADFTLRVSFGPINQETQYSLDNRWSQDNGGYHIDWTMTRSADVLWIEGRHDIAPVTIDGQAMTLVKYYNYINPKTMRPLLNSGLARTENKKQISRLVNLLRTWVETDPNGALASQVTSFCGRWQCQR